MGQQQLLLLVAGIVLVSLAVIAGVNQYEKASTEAIRDGIKQEGLRIGHAMVSDNLKPKALGGAGQGNWKVEHFQRVTGVEKGSVYDSPYGRIQYHMTMGSGGNIAYLLCFPNTGNASPRPRSIVPIRLTAGRKDSNPSSVKITGKTWMGKAGWLKRQGILDDEGEFTE